MKTIYVVLDGIAVGSMEMEENAPLLEAIRKKYPDAEHATERAKSPDDYTGDAIIIEASTKK